MKLVTIPCLLDNIPVLAHADMVILVINSSLNLSTHLTDTTLASSSGWRLVATMLQCPSAQCWDFKHAVAAVAGGVLVEAATAMLQYLAHLPAAEARVQQHFLARMAIRHVEVLKLLLDEPTGSITEHTMFTHLTGTQSQICLG